MDARFMTEKEKERMRRDNRIVERYKGLREQYPSVPRRRLLLLIAKEENGSANTYYQLLKRYGVTN